MRERLKATLRRVIKCYWTPLGVCLLMCMAVALLMLTGCAQKLEVPVVKETCPQLPQLPAQFEKAQVNALERTEQSFASFMRSN